jgi:hypothetical protein
MVKREQALQGGAQLCGFEVFFLHELSRTTDVLNST